MNRIGNDAFLPFMKNVEECKKHCHLSFGVDATNLSATEKQWNGIEYGCKFDRILATFPRIYHQAWSRWTYKEQNKILAYKLLKCWESYLAVNGEIHWLFLGNQFYNWWVKKTLHALGMQLEYWCKLEDEMSLNKCFPGYTPRDDWGNQINLRDWPMFLCCFKRVKRKPLPIQHENIIQPIKPLPIKHENIIQPIKPLPIKHENVIQPIKSLPIKHENIIQPIKPLPIKHENVIQPIKPLAIKHENII
eukprot:524651_1